MTNSRRKGAAGEREFAHALRDAIGVTLERQLDQCRAGGFDLAPLPGDTSTAASALRRFAIEVKRHRTATAGEVAVWWAQAARQADEADLVALLAYRSDRRPWRIVLALDVVVPAVASSSPVSLEVEGFVALLGELPGRE